MRNPCISAERSAKSEGEGKRPTKKGAETKKEADAKKGTEAKKEADVKDEKKKAGPKKKPKMGPKRRMAQIKATRGSNVSLSEECLVIILGYFFLFL